jgi:transcription initiation factor IIF auxiliary subunit
MTTTAIKTIEHLHNAGDNLAFRTKATSVGKDWYEWSVEVDPAAQALGNIEEVEYILHPTFPNRIRRETSSSNNFRLESEGWGEFDIAVNVYFKDGDEKTVIVPLKFT